MNLKHHEPSIRSGPGADRRHAGPVAAFEPTHVVTSTRTGREVSPDSRGSIGDRAAVRPALPERAPVSGRAAGCGAAGRRSALPPGCPAPSQVLVEAVLPSGRAWAARFDRVDPMTLVSGRPVPTGRFCTIPPAAGALHLPGREDRERLGTSVLHALARPFRLLWQDPRTGRACSHVPSFLLVEIDRVALIDVLPDPAARPRRGAPTTAWLAGTRGWHADLLCGTDPWVDRDPLVDAILDAPHGLVSQRLHAACLLERPTAELVGAISTPGDLVVLLPILRQMAADA